MTGPRTRVLFFAEAVTLAHVARPVMLAHSLDPERYDVHLAHSPRYRQLLGKLTFTEHELSSITPQQFMAALDQGKPLYDLPTLTAYVEEDLRLIADSKPDIVVGDFRLSLAVSARLAGVPYITISNACWSPYTDQEYTVPELPLTRRLGVRTAQWLFTLGRPAAFAMHCLPMHRLRRRFGLDSLGFNLGEVYTHADLTLYADIPGLYNMRSLPQTHRFLGPLVWSPAIALPQWWQQLPTDRPFVYVTLGSSGQAALLPKVLSALGRMDVTALVSTAGVEWRGETPANVYWEKYLPGEQAVKVSSLVVCNGGSPTTHQALLHGVPVLGLAGNLDQYLNMATLERVGAGRLMRAGTSDARDLAKSMAEVMADTAMSEAAQSVSRRIKAVNALTEFNRIIDEVRSGRRI